MQKPAPLGEKAGNGHRTDAGVALEHLDQRVLHREPQHLLAFLAEQLGDRLYHAGFSRPGYALDRYDPVTRRKDKARGILLSFVQRNSVVERGNCLNPFCGVRSIQDGQHRTASLVDIRENGAFKSKRLAARQPAFMFAFAGLKCAASDQCVHTGFDMVHRRRQPKIERRLQQSLPRECCLALREMAHRRGNGLRGRDGWCILLEDMGRDQRISRISRISLDPLRELSQLGNPALKKTLLFRTADSLRCSTHLGCVNQSSKVKTDLFGSLAPRRKKALAIAHWLLAFACFERCDNSCLKSVPAPGCEYFLAPR